MSYKILVVEDDPELRTIYRQILERGGYTVFEAQNGVEALTQFDVVKPDLIILDMMMPTMSGEEVLGHLRDKPNGPHTPFIIITAYPKFRESALNYRVDHFLTKPVRPQEILQAIEAVFGEK